MTQRERKHQEKCASNGKLTKQKVDAVVAAINRGELSLPDLKFSHDDDYITVWALADTGSAATVTDHAKHFPGAVLRKSKAAANSFGPAAMGASKCAGTTRSKSHAVTFASQALAASGARE